MAAADSQASIIITGLANSGKTQIFNRLTGGYRLVANYPMTTIESAYGTYNFRGTRFQVIDTPGLNSVSSDSAEQLLFRRLLVSDNPQVLLQCADANRLRQSLRLTAELLDLGIPMVLSINAIDETVKRGISIDADKLSRLLGIPVVVTSAAEGVGLYDLKEALAEPKMPNQTQPRLGEDASRLCDAICQELPGELKGRQKTSILLLERDPHLFEIELAGLNDTQREELIRIRDRVAERIRGNLKIVISRDLAQWTDHMYDSVVTRGEPGGRRDISTRLAYYSRHPLYGLLFLGIFLAAAYLGVVVAAGALASGMDRVIAQPFYRLLENRISSLFFKDLLIGDFGLLTLGLFNALFTVLPILSIFFLLFGLVEDIGYLPNVSVLLRRAFSKIGLSGRAVMPIILGFGCKTMATLTTRSLTSRKERLIAIYLIAFAIPCAPQLALNIAILGRAGLLPFLIALIFLVIAEILAGKILNTVIADDQRGFFIQELPPFRLPGIKAIVQKTLYRIWWFLKEAVPVFVLSAGVLFIIDRIGILDMIKQVLRPIVVTWMGLPIEMVEALILLIAREEAAAGLILRISDLGLLTAIQSIVAVVVTTMFVPCFANVVAIFKESGIRAGILILLAINFSTIVLAGVLNHLLLFAQPLLGF